MNGIDGRNLKHPKEQNVSERHNRLDILEEELRQWCFEITDRENNRIEFLGRLEIAEKIIECYLEQRPNLDLSRTRCYRLPSIHEIRHITSLDLSDNQYIEIQPDQLDELSHLENLNISNCRIRSSPDLKKTLRKIPSVKSEGSSFILNQ